MTNGEFLEFVESGGYRNRHLWTDEGIGSVHHKVQNPEMSCAALRSLPNN